jgi:hypothetical protein
LLLSFLPCENSLCLSAGQSKLQIALRGRPSLRSAQDEALSLSHQRAQAVSGPEILDYGFYPFFWMPDALADKCCTALSSSIVRVETGEREQA